MAAHEGSSLSLADSQAADWLARLQRERTSASEHAELQRWLDESPAHAVAFARAEFAWERAERLRATPGQARNPSFSSPLPAGERVRVRGRFHLRSWAIAAMLSFITIGIATWYFTAQWRIYATGLGERRTIALSDGSQINLNTSSRIEVDFGSRARAVRLLKGEALFKVAPDTQRPFTVEADETVVRALGTAFNVRMRSQVVEITVTEGLVSVDGKDRIAAGSSAVAAAGAVNRVSLTEDALRRRVAWREGVIELKGETLEQAVEEFNRYREHKLIVADPAIATLRVGGRFETDEAVKFVNALKANFAIRALDKDGGNIYLLGPQ